VRRALLRLAAVLLLAALGLVLSRAVPLPLEPEAPDAPEAPEAPDALDAPQARCAASDAPAMQAGDGAAVRAARRARAGPARDRGVRVAAASAAGR